MDLEQFAQKAGLKFRDSSYLRRALTHRSYVNEFPEALEDNERLEFLGDAALDFLTASWLYNRFPEMDEGQLTRLRSALVRTEQLAEFAEQIELGKMLLLGRGEELNGGRARPAILCAGFEALIGALYLDSGVEAVVEFLEPLLAEATRALLEEESLLDPRSLLQIWSQAQLGDMPHYQTVESFGPDHAREFIVEVSIEGEVLGRGRGRSKQDAAQRAAEDALSNVHLISR